MSEQVRPSAAASQLEMARWRYRASTAYWHNRKHSRRIILPHHSNYPSEIARAICDRWHQQNYDVSLIPTESRVATLVDVMYQASLLCEESEPVQCRVLVCNATDFTDELNDGASRLQVLRFVEPCVLTPHQVRKLGAAAGYYRALLAVHFDENDQALIWGMVSTGTDWVNRVHAASDRHDDLPGNLVIHCLGPGHLIASTGYARVLESAGGRILTEGFDPFRSTWLPKRFGNVRADLLHLIDLQDQASSRIETRMCDDFVRDLAQSVVRRTLRLVRTRGHGGMLVYLPDALVGSEQLQSWLRLRVQFERDDSTLRFRRVMLQVIARAREIGHSIGLKTVTYQDYRLMSDMGLVALEATLVELGHFFADLMSVDGALVFDRSFRLIGFGGEILGDSHVVSIHQAMNVEATQTIAERADASGTRHRSAYRLVSGLPETIAVVVSQDGDVRFVAQHKDKLTYWPYLP